MSEQLTLIERLGIVEKELAELKERVARQETNGSWIERIAGTFKDDPEFDEIVRLGREFRRSVQ
jgi:hypothetical protein